MGESADSDCENVEPELAPAVRGHYKHFTRKQTFAVKEYAKMHGIRAATKHFKVPNSTVNNWNKTSSVTIIWGIVRTVIYRNQAAL